MPFDPTPPEDPRPEPPPPPSPPRVSVMVPALAEVYEAALRRIADHGRMPGGSDVFNGSHHREAVMIAREALAHGR